MSVRGMLYVYSSSGVGNFPDMGLHGLLVGDCSMPFFFGVRNVNLKSFGLMENVLGKWQIVSLMVAQKNGRIIFRKFDEGEYVMEIPFRDEISALYHAYFLSDTELILCDPVNNAVIELAKI